jgi:hypothetical protein
MSLMPQPIPIANLVASHHVASRSNSNNISSEWSCQSCTYLNGSYASICDVCRTPNGHVIQTLVHIPTGKTASIMLPLHQPLAHQQLQQQQQQQRQSTTTTSAKVSSITTLAPTCSTESSRALLVAAVAHGNRNDDKRNDPKPPLSLSSSSSSSSRRHVNGLLNMTDYVMLISLWGLDAISLASLNGVSTLFNKINSIWSLSITEEAARLTGKPIQFQLPIIFTTNKHSQTCNLVVRRYAKFGLELRQVLHNKGRVHVSMMFDDGDRSDRSCVCCINRMIVG